MAKHVLYNASLVANSVDLSDHVSSVEFTVGLNAQPAAAMGELQDYSMAGTQKISAVKAKFFADFASSKVYATFWSLFVNRTTFNVVIKADAGATAATNPAWTIPVIISDFPVVNGSRGDAHMVDVTFEPAGTYSVATS